MTIIEFLNVRAERRDVRWDRRVRNQQRRWELRQLAKAQRIAAGLAFAQRIKGPTERQGVTIGMFGLTLLMLAMVRERPGLWDVKLFEVVFQAVVLTGLLNMILAFHFSANKSDEVRTANTGKMADAMKAVAESSTPPSPGPDPATNSLGDPPADAESPTGAPGDPVHVTVEDNPSGT